MADPFPPFLVFVFAAAILPFIPNGQLRAGLSLIVPVISAAMILNLPEGVLGQVSVGGVDLTLLRVDKLSVIFGLVFSIAAFLSLLYAFHVRDKIHQVATLLYAGSAIGAVFAGDLATLFIFWEGTAIASVFLIWARRTQGAYATGMRYLIIQVASGVILLAGLILYQRNTGSLAFEAMQLGSTATWLILIAFGIKAAFPLLHNWLHDAYPSATITGTVILSAFTTKLAIYALARGFPGTDLLIYVGATMAIFPLFHATIENDMRKVLVYILNNQLGFMVIGVGIGTELALSGTAAHAFSHILYKSLLFMGIGAVLYRTGTSKASELGGLYRTMPLTLMFCLIGAASTSMPLFSGFVTKSLILSEAASGGHPYAWGILVFASAAAFLVLGLKLPWFVFFAKDSGLRPAEAPRHMLLAMGGAAFLCILIGLQPNLLYELLPYETEYHAYTKTHVITQMQLLFFTTLAFVITVSLGFFPAMKQGVNLDTDVIYRKFMAAIIKRGSNIISTFWAIGGFMAKLKLQRFVAVLHRSHGPEGRMARVWPTGAMVLWMAVILGASMMVGFVKG
jgi:multicomponent Na+:H+ antiporter subunit D